MTDPVVFPFPPNLAGADWIIRRAWRTEILPARDGGEQRRALRQWPRIDIEFPLTLTDNCRRRFHAFMLAGQRRPVLIHDLSRSVSLPAGLAGASDTAVVSSVPVWLVEGATVLLVEASRIEVRIVESIESGNDVTFTTSTAQPWSSSARVHAALRCRLDDTVPSSIPDPRGVIETTILAATEPGYEPLEDERSPGPVLDGREVFAFFPDRVRPLGVSLVQDRDRVDADFGRFQDFYPVAYAMSVTDAIFTACSPQNAADLLGFVLRMKGQRGEFWFSTRLPDLLPTLQAGSGTSALRVSGDVTAYDDDPIHVAIAARRPDGVILYNRIASMAAAGGDTVLTLQTPWSADVPVASRVSWLRLQRLASDSYEQRWVGRDVAQSGLTFRDLSYVTAE